MIDLAPDRRDLVRPLFANFPYLHGLACAVLAGAFGQAFVDRKFAPTTGMLCDDDFVFLAGDAATAAAGEMISSRPPGSFFIVETDAWRTAIHQIWGERLAVCPRVALSSPDAWDVEHLRSLTRALPAEMVVRQIMPDDAGRFADLAESLAEIDEATGMPSMGEGIGFGVELDGRFVAGCAGWPGGGRVELEVQTHPEFRRRGLATIASAALIDYCLAHDLIPCWDAANQMSAGLGLKLGFVEPIAYDAYLLV